LFTKKEIAPFIKGAMATIPQSTVIQPVPQAVVQQPLQPVIQGVVQQPTSHAVVQQQPVVGTSYISTTSTPVPSYATPLEWALILFVIILVLGFIIWVIWYLGFRKTGKPQGDKCSANSDCEQGTFCSSNGTCIVGEGGKEGDVCEINTQCIMGLLCDPGTRRCTRALGPL
jgi:hypothetical protein